MFPIAGKGKYGGALLRTFLTVLLMVSGAVQGVRGQFVPDEWRIPANSNSYVTSLSEAARTASSQDRTAPIAEVNRMGIILKNDSQSVASTYIYISKPAEPELSLMVLGEGKLNVSCGDETFNLAIDAKKWERVSVGKLKISTPDYIKIDFRLSDAIQPAFIVVRDVFLSNLPVKPVFVNPNYSEHFGRCGASVQLILSDSAVTTADMVYNEMSVPDSCDAVGSYYCAQDFNTGSFGVQRYSDEERRVVFSVWNAVVPEQNKKMPRTHSVKLIAKGDSTIVEDLNEGGDGKVCFVRYNWRTGENYKFLIRAEVADSQSSNYSAYFYAPERNSWIYISTLRCPAGTALFPSVYAFVENFLPDEGYRMHKAFFSNFWLRNRESGLWKSASKVRFSFDDTGRRGIRLDYDGGVERQMFYLRTGGFFGNGSRAERHLELPAPLSDVPPANFDQILNK